MTENSNLRFRMAVAEVKQASDWDALIEMPPRIARPADLGMGRGESESRLAGIPPDLA